MACETAPGNRSLSPSFSIMDQQCSIEGLLKVAPNDKAANEAKATKTILWKLEICLENSIIFVLPNVLTCLPCWGLVKQ